MKISFPLVRDQDDYPPADWEHLWAISRGIDQYELDNIPFFAKGVSAGDIVSARRDDDQLIFDRVLRHGGHSTVRIIMLKLDEKEGVRNELAVLGCESEGSHLPNLFAVDVPPNVNYAQVASFLAEKAEKNILDYEEAAIQHRVH